MNTFSPLSRSLSEHPVELAGKLDGMFRTAMAERLFSGASLAVAGPDHTIFRRDWGRTFDGGAPVDEHSLFDLASLTKPLVTASLCMEAVAKGILDPDDSLERFLPKGLLPSSKRDISVRHLLDHSSGLPSYSPIFLQVLAQPPSRRREFMLKSILDLPLASLPGKVSHYSDPGFILLGILLEELLGVPLDTLAASLFAASPSSRAELIYRRLDVARDPTVPPAAPSAIGRVFVATEQCPWRRRLLIGEVHDENAYSLGGVAGHAGLFGTAAGVAGWLDRLWRLFRGEVPAESRLAAVVREFWSRSSPSPDGTWLLGFDTPSPAGSSAGNCFSPRSIGHLGFTGTSFWLDLDGGILVVLLTNRVYPSRHKEGIKEFRPLVHDTIMKGIHAA